MQPFTHLDAIAAPLPLANVDTDKILAGRFLKTISREGLGEKLFWSLRQDPAFVLNRAPWADAGILIALDNFGCGSSREHAPWALLDFGIRCVIAPSIADIFYNNCFKNGILPVVLPVAEVNRLMDLTTNPATAQLTVDLPTQSILAAEGVPIRFDIDPRLKRDLLEGVDEIGDTLARINTVSGERDCATARRPWLTNLQIAELPSF
jgi:3-isopropylmalate/(R)-2-methylmalate dehydratase small subunit